MQKELKEKEQENRISKLKIKEMKRLIKHNQLRPIHKDNISPNRYNSSTSKSPIRSIASKNV